MSFKCALYFTDYISWNVNRLDHFLLIYCNSHLFSLHPYGVQYCLACVFLCITIPLSSVSSLALPQNLLTFNRLLYLTSLSREEYRVEIVIQLKFLTTKMIIQIKFLTTKMIFIVLIVIQRSCISVNDYFWVWLLVWEYIQKMVLTWWSQHISSYRWPWPN